MSILNKISLIFTGITGVIILLLSVFVYFFAANGTFEMFFHRLEVRAAIIGHAYIQDDKSNAAIYHSVKERHLERLPDENHYIIELEGGEAGIDPSERPGLPLNQAFYNELLQTGKVRYFSENVFYVGELIRERDKNIAIISEAVDTLGMAELAYLKKLLILGFFGSVVVTYSLGRIFSNHIFSPVRQIVEKVKGISVHNLNERLENSKTDDVIADLSNTFNDMLNRLHITFEMQNNFISNASHEFKTPLTIIAGEAELGVAEQNLPDHIKQSLDTINNEAEKLKELIDGMLAIAQTGFDGIKQHWGEVRLDEIILSVKNTINKIHVDNKVEVDYNDLPDDDEMLCLEGNSSLLRVALSNIVMNACKYSDNNQVRIKVTADTKRIYVQVSDKGIGIPEHELPQVFVPFFRASNTHKYNGHGVGLPLANNIIRMHKGHVNVKSKEGEGTTVIVYFPHLGN
jgi:signal transduction histidine kinase